MAAEEAFQQLKAKMVSLPVLALPDFEKPFTIEADASGHGMGAVFMQEQRRIAYFSQVFSQLGSKKSVYERELMAIVFGMKKWTHYLLGRKFFIRTDQKSLKHLMEQREVSPEYLKWMVKLLGYQFEIHYRVRMENKAVDVLSKIYHTATLMALTVPRVVHLEQVAIEVNTDAGLQKITQELQADPSSHPNFQLVDKHLVYKGQLYLPKGPPLIPLIL